MQISKNNFKHYPFHEAFLNFTKLITSPESQTISSSLYYSSYLIFYPFCCTLNNTVWSLDKDGALFICSIPAINTNTLVERWIQTKGMLQKVPNSGSPILFWSSFKKATERHFIYSQSKEDE